MARDRQQPPRGGAAEARPLPVTPRSCGTCACWARAGEVPGKGAVGECRLGPPAVVAEVTPLGPLARHALTPATGYCSKHQTKPAG